MTTAAFALQPTAWGEFDPHGADWAIDMSHAYRLAKVWGEPVTLWRVPNGAGEAYRWAEIKPMAKLSTAS